jgi:hypothetical protein
MAIARAFDATVIDVITDQPYLAVGIDVASSVGNADSVGALEVADHALATTADRRTVGVEENRLAEIADEVRCL